MESKQAPVDPVRLRVELRLAMERSLAQVISASSQISATAQDQRVRQTCLYWKIRSLDTYLSIVSESDSRVAFMQEWFNAVRQRQQFTEGTGKAVFGPDQPKVVALARGIEEDIKALGRRNFAPGTIDAAQPEIEKAADQYRATAPFEPTPLLMPEAIGNVSSILKLPSMPGGLEGVADAAAAINRFTDTSQNVALVLQHLPERTRWQSEVLLQELDATGPVPTLVRELHEGVSSIKSLPQETRAEFEKSLDAMDKSHPQLRATLAEARGVAEQTSSAAEQATQAAKAFGALATEARGLLADYRQMLESEGASAGPSGNPATRPAGDSSPPNVRDYRITAESAGTAAKEVRSLLRDLQQPVPADAGVHQVAAEFRGLIDYAFWRAVMMIAIVLGLVLAFRGLAWRFPMFRRWRGP
jgi:hypothetical protein